jgi:transglutaminase/protease-like cytokinesis protein 3
MRLNSLVLTLFLLQISGFSELNAQIEVSDKDLQYYSALSKEIEIKNGDQFKKLVRKIEKLGKNDQERVILAYTWIAQNINYDVRAYLSKKYRPPYSKIVLNDKKAVCGGFADLFNELCLAMNIESETVLGYAKGAGYSENQKPLEHPNHAWNAVKINGKWQLIDSKWGSGYITKVKGKYQYKRKFKKKYLFASPEMFLKTHLPEDVQWQLTKDKIDKAQFYSEQNVIR